MLDSDTPVLVDFWAEWCVPCHMVSPVVEEIGQEQKGRALKVAKLNIDDNPEMTRKYGVMSIPCLILFKDGKRSPASSAPSPRTPCSRTSSRTCRLAARPAPPQPATRCRRRRADASHPTAAILGRVRIIRHGDRGEDVRDVQHA